MAEKSGTDNAGSLGMTKSQLVGADPLHHPLPWPAKLRKRFINGSGPYRHLRESRPRQPAQSRTSQSLLSPLSHPDLGRP